MKTRILVVEDDEDMRELLCRQLEFFGYEVEAAKDGEEAVIAAVAKLPDLIIMDIVMPKMSGSEALSRIRDNPKTRSIPVLAATGRWSPTAREQYLASGFNDFIAKPFTHQQLRGAIGKLLGVIGKAAAMDELSSGSTKKPK